MDKQSENDEMIFLKLNELKISGNKTYKQNRNDIMERNKIYIIIKRTKEKEIKQIMMQFKQK